ncbi:MAG: isoleucine--tRNA ligase [archaeon]
MQKYDPSVVEPKVLEFWEKNEIHKKANDKNKGKQKFYFLDGPPYTSGKVHIGTAWNKSLKDIIIRYKRMQGLDVWDRAGYDMHGLPTEGKVQHKLNMKTKEEILAYGLDKFIKDCKDFSLENLYIMNKDFKRLGVWMDFDNPYMSIKNEYIEGTWWLVKKAHDKGRLYEGQKTMTWCASCQTALAKHELEYKEVTDKSIFVKFRVKGTDNEFLIIWTTTPWTIPFNLAVMVHPEFEYVKAKVEDEIWIVSKVLAAALITGVCDKKFTIIEEFSGEKLEGVEYEHPLSDVLGDQYRKIKKESKKAFSVIMSSEYVDLSAGTGLVHCAPGCGPEDYEVGHREGIKPYNTLNESGVFPKIMGEFKSLTAKKDDACFIEALKKRGALVAITEVEHDYAHCWRCKEPVIYRTTTQWFFKIEDLIEKMRELNKDCNWVPDWAGTNQFDSWLKNLRDNGITRQRFWGSPLPVWQCKSCKNFVVVESRKELKALGASHIPEDIHRPWIDEVTLPCKCGHKMEKITDIMDVWIDAGTACWSCLDFPHRDDLMNQLYPADFILEGKDQIRGWFNLLFVASMLSREDMCFKACYMHGFVNDSQGRKMSKSLGNVISPYEVIDKYGADAFRYYSISGANPGLDLNYNVEDCELKRRNLEILWNLFNYVVDLASTVGINPAKIDESIFKKSGIEEKFMLSKLNSSIKKVTELMDKYYLEQAPIVVEELFLSLSRTYIQMVREKANSDDEDEKQLVLYVVYNALFESLKLFSIVAPFLTEEIYQNLKEKFGLSEESIHLYPWPTYDESAIDTELEKNINAMKEIMQAIFNAREKSQLGIRWPLSEAVVITKDDETKKAILALEDAIKKQTNIKSIVLKDKFAHSEVKIKANFKTMGPDFGSLTPKVIAALANESDSSIESKLAKGNGTFELSVDGKKVIVKESHLTIEKIVPHNYILSSFRGGEIYLNTNRTAELAAEGFSREVIRRVQSARKEAGLTKTQEVSLYLEAVDELKGNLLSYEDMICQRTGAKSVMISTKKPKEKFSFSKEDNVKGLKFTIYMSW